jgi:hypothetical protein
MEQIEVKSIPQRFSHFCLFRLNIQCFRQHGTSCPRVEDRKDLLQLRMVAVNTLNTQLRTADRR